MIEPDLANVLGRLREATTAYLSVVRDAHQLLDRAQVTDEAYQQDPVYATTADALQEALEELTVSTASVSNPASVLELIEAIMARRLPRS